MPTFLVTGILVEPTSVDADYYANENGFITFYMDGGGQSASFKADGVTSIVKTSE